MKKAFIIAALVIVSFANAQKGSVLVAGNVGFASTKQGDYKVSSFEFNPKVGYQFSDNSTVGIELGIGNLTQTMNNSIYERTDSTFKLGAFLRYSQPLAGIFSVYGDFGLGMQSAKISTNVPGDGVSRFDGIYIGVVPAIAIDMKKGFCLNFSFGGLGYDSMKEDFNGAEAENNFNLNFGKQANIGISKNF